MDIKLTNQSIETIACDALVIGVAYQRPEQQSPVLSRTAGLVNGQLGGLLQELITSGEFKGEVSELATIHTMGKLAAKRVVLVGLGKQEQLQAQAMQRACGTAARYLQNTGAHSITLACMLEDARLDIEAQAQAEIEGALTGIYTFKKYQHVNSVANERGISKINVIADAAQHAGLESACQRAIALSEATNFARDLVNEPPNVLTPTELANRASLVAKQFGLDFEALDRPQMQELGMGGLLSVSQGSAEPAKFIIMHYRGAPTPTAKDVVLIGKGITFDTGGISIKPAENMYKMKGDMAGAAAVIGALYAIAALKPAINVTVLVPTTENMPSGTAYRPGDILRIMNGKTIEIVNTDAEGRLVLADALSYAVIKEQAATIIDVATLTGGIVVALGSVMSGVFCNDDGLSAEIIAAGQAAGEKFWRMPLDDEYAEAIHSDVADIKQTGGRPASSVTAAKILEHFVGDTHWAHLDIAGTDFSDTKKSYQEKGATGFAARTLAELVLKRAE
ncbi:MAG TPA: leucyl aminopeptidase [Ktedonobacteraceae bacterium]|nr:leucyl aminopeptidase [Ktedonobacteraceae bacterium]